MNTTSPLLAPERLARLAAGAAQLLATGNPIDLTGETAGHFTGADIRYREGRLEICRPGTNSRWDLLRECSLEEAADLASRGLGWFRWANAQERLEKAILAAKR